MYVCVPAAVCPAAAAARWPPEWRSGQGSGPATGTGAAPAGEWRSADGQKPVPVAPGSPLQPRPRQ